MKDIELILKNNDRIPIYCITKRVTGESYENAANRLLAESQIDSTLDQWQPIKRTEVIERLLSSLKNGILGLQAEVMNEKLAHQFALSFIGGADQENLFFISETLGHTEGHSRKKSIVLTDSVADLGFLAIKDEQIEIIVLAEED
ncbi:hypothetical protein [Vibrio neptunius]|uniref:Uncharacterized protein n=1 Tax=Vibrio neptunius TaxID=170651 RepID=A0ABS3A0J8_9VIBR|nr:hypothetical protein [Vibrio neptunius]MBN3492715.1 hypothetical protein [Vibrio neptunius]MBN3515212.1 hypothetical protein [Vibrio neptunius]MBN3548912.1 hypothetical protein [Vibrio neptunius]MBN3577374.1 hypothetical protein [Vibrio neptunius]MCH9871038.1 hypothetical protein [Vibrio neptunius]